MLDWKSQRNAAGRSASSVLLDWVGDQENFDRYRNVDPNSKKETTILKQIAKHLKANGISDRTNESIKIEIDRMCDTYIDAHDWLMFNEDTIKKTTYDASDFKKNKQIQKTKIKDKLLEICEEYDTIDVVYGHYPSVTPPAPSRDSDDENVAKIFGFEKDSNGDCVYTGEIDDDSDDDDDFIVVEKYLSVRKRNTIEDSALVSKKKTRV